MQKDSFEWAQLFSDYLLNKMTVEEECKFMNLIDNDPNKKRLLDYYKDTAPAQERLDYINSLDVDAAWKRTLDRSNLKRQKRKWANIVKYVAVFFIMLSSAIVWFTYSNKDKKIVADHVYSYKNDILPGSNQAELILSSGESVILDSNATSVTEENGMKLVVDGSHIDYTSAHQLADDNETRYNTLRVPKAGTYSLRLPDGTKVWLNAMSELRFPIRFNADERRIELKGEGYFQVAKDPEHPFKIILNGSEIEVVGTTFNTSSYHKTSKTTLIEGIVKVKNNNKTIYLKPGQQALATAAELNVAKGDIEKATAWKNGHFYFSNDAIQPVLEEIGRWYDLKIIYKTKLPDIHIGGGISRKVNLSEVLEMIKDVSGLSFEIDGRNLIVK